MTTSDHPAPTGLAAGIRHNFFPALVILVLTAVVVMCMRQADSVGVQTAVTINDPANIYAGGPAPDFEMATLDGQTIRLSDLRG